MCGGAGAYEGSSASISALIDSIVERKTTSYVIASSIDIKLPWAPNDNGRPDVQLGTPPHSPPPNSFYSTPSSI